jgi:hypothetical protein
MALWSTEEDDEQMQPYQINRFIYVFILTIFALVRFALAENLHTVLYTSETEPTWCTSHCVWSTVPAPDGR